MEFRLWALVSRSWHLPAMSDRRGAACSAKQSVVEVLSPESPLPPMSAAVLLTSYREQERLHLHMLKLASLTSCLHQVGAGT